MVTGPGGVIELVKRTPPGKMVVRFLGPIMTRVDKLELIFDTSKNSSKTEFGNDGWAAMTADCLVFNKSVKSVEYGWISDDTSTRNLPLTEKPSGSL